MVGRPTSGNGTLSGDKLSPMWGRHSIDLVELFVEWMEVRGMSPATIKRRRSSLASFIRWCAPLELTLVEAEHVENWLRTLANKRTRSAYRSDLAAFYDWARRRKIIPDNPMLEVDTVRRPKSEPRPVPAEYVREIIGTCQNGRLRIALMLAAYAGLRRAEICALHSDDISLHPSRPRLVVRHGKGDKDRVVPLHPRLVKSFAERKPKGRVVPWEPDTLGRLAAEHMRSLGHDYTLHQLRGSCATELARVTHGDVVRIARFLGHEDTNTTIRYIGFSDDSFADELPGLYSA
jgi:integrase/recombinase XerC